MWTTPSYKSKASFIYDYSWRSLDSIATHNVFFWSEDSDVIGTTTCEMKIAIGGNCKGHEVWVANSSFAGHTAVDAVWETTIRTEDLDMSIATSVTNIDNATLTNTHP